MRSISGKNISLDAAVRDVEQRYVAANPRSREQFERACQSMPGGNTRSVLFYDPFPVTLAGGSGARVTDLDGNVYTDFLGEFTAGLYGHSNPKIIAAVSAALKGGIVLGGPSEYESRLADLICARFPSCDMVRFCNSGTEANLMAISLARAVTNRSHIMVFEGAYHGGVLNYPAQGVPTNVPIPTILARYNDADAARSLIDRHAGNLAAILVEPMMGNAGGIAGELDFLTALREGADRQGIVLIFDEVMTSRLSPSGLQGKLGVLPDLSTFGKYMGGGLTFGAFGGRKDLMSRFDPRRPDALAHSGTYNNNVLTMAAGYTGLGEILTPEAITRLNEGGDRLRDRLNDLARRSAVPALVTGLGSILCVHFQEGPIRSPADTERTPAAARKLFQLEMSLRGYFLARRGFMSLSLAMTEADHLAFAAAFEEFLAEHVSVLA